MPSRPGEFHPIPEEGQPPVLTSSTQKLAPESPVDSMAAVSSIRVRTRPMATNPISTLLQRFACARLSQPACRNLVPTFPQRSAPLLLTTAACGGLRSTPDCRPRRTFLHLSYSCATPFGPAILVTQDPTWTSLHRSRLDATRSTGRRAGSVRSVFQARSP
jgi:hypothetical protein